MGGCKGEQAGRQARGKRREARRGTRAELSRCREPSCRVVEDEASRIRCNQRPDPSPDPLGTAATASRPVKSHRHTCPRPSHLPTLRSPHPSTLPAPKPQGQCDSPAGPLPLPRHRPLPSHPSHPHPIRIPSASLPSSFAGRLSRSGIRVGPLRQLLAGCGMPDAGCRMPDAACRMPDAGSGKQDGRRRMQDAGRRM
jgi:hypothetical protein